MLTRMVFVAAALVGSLSALAQAAPAREVVGTLTGKNVFVRSNPSTTGAYQCTQLSTGDKVVVLKAQGEWLQIKPVKGTWSVMAKKFVKPDAAGKIGTVTGDNVWVRAAGELCTFANVADYYVWQGQLNKGDTVTIIGEAGDYYKIAPPDFATFWIAAKYVDLGGKTVAEESDDGVADAPNTGAAVKSRKAPASEKVTVRESDGKTTTVTTTETTTVRRTASGQELDPKSAFGQVEAVRLEMMAEYKKPIEQRDLRRIIDKFNAIDTSDDERAGKIAAYYVKYMENQLTVIDEAKAASAQIEKKKAAITQIKVTMDKEVIEIQTNPKPKAFNAQGVLRESAAFPGTKFSPQRWIVYDPQLDRITAYVQCTTGEVDVKAFVGKHVGVWGTEVYYEHLKLYVIDAQEIVVLGEAEPLPARPAVKVTVRPVLAPAAESEATVTVKVVDETAVEDEDDAADDDEALDDADDEDDEDDDEDEEEDDEEDEEEAAVDSVVVPAKKN